MIIIQKHGITEKNKLYQATCPKCKCQFTFNGTDIKSDQCEAGDWVNCPENGCYTAITSWKEVPQDPHDPDYQTVVNYYKK